MSLSEKLPTPAVHFLTLRWKILIAVAFIFLVGVTASVLGVFYLNLQTIRPFARASCEPVVVSISQGEGAKTIAKELEARSLIKNDLYFLYYVSASGLSGKLQAGEYEFTPCMSIREIAQRMKRGEVIQDIAVTLPEGFTLREIEERLRANNFQFTISNFQTRDFSAEYSFLRDAPADAALEGYLFPDTYFLKKNSSREDIVRKMLDNFEKKLTSDLRAAISVQGKTMYEVMTMASLLEKEVRTPEDKALVAGVLWKRLSVMMPLQVDATITYVLNKKTTELTYEDLKIDSPYNTYRNRGFPLGPISNPGIESVKAAIYPAESDYWYYLSKPDGETVFTKTLEEHNRAKALYLR